jgi:hypothetical protein
MNKLSKAEIFRRAAELFAGGVSRSQPSWDELGDRAFAGMIAELRHPEHYITLRCRDAGYE